MVDDGRGFKFLGEMPCGAFIGALKTLRIGQRRMGYFVEDALVNPANLGRLGVPRLPFVLLGLAELAGGARLMEDPLLSLEVEFIPVEVSVFRKGLCVAEDLAVALAEKIDGSLRDIRQDDGLFPRIIIDADAQSAEAVGKLGLEIGAVFVDTIGGESAGVD